MLEVKFRNIELMHLLIQVRKVKNLQVVNSVLADGEGNTFRGIVVLTSSAILRNDDVDTVDDSSAAIAGLYILLLNRKMEYS